MQIYAIGMKGWVELRRGMVPPKEHHTEVEKEIEETIQQPPTYRFVEAENRWIYTEHKPKKVKITFKMNNTIFTGGRVAGVMKAATFSRLTKIGIREGGIVQLLPDHISILQKKGYIKRGKSHTSKATKQTVDKN